MIYLTDKLRELGKSEKQVEVKIERFYEVTIVKRHLIYPQTKYLLKNGYSSK